MKLRGIRQAPSHESSLLKSRKLKSPQERKLHTPTKNRVKLKGDRLESPAPISSSRFSLRKTPARLKYLGDNSEPNDESDSVPDYTPLRSAGISVNQLRGTKDISTPAVSILENARITRQRAKKAIQQD